MLLRLLKGEHKFHLTVKVIFDDGLNCVFKFWYGLGDETKEPLEAL